MNGLIDLDACVKNLKQMLAQIAQQGQEKYPQDEEPNEYRYIHFPWIDKIAEGLTAGAQASGRNVEGHPRKGARRTRPAASLAISLGRYERAAPRQRVHAVHDGVCGGGGRA